MTQKYYRFSSKQKTKRMLRNKKYLKIIVIINDVIDRSSLISLEVLYSMLYRDEPILKQQQKQNQDNVPNYGLEPQIWRVLQLNPYSVISKLKHH